MSDEPRWGLLARCDSRGLAWQTWDRFVATRPVKTLVVLAGRATPYVEDPSRFLDAGIGEVRVAEWVRSFLPDRHIAWLLDGIDALYTAETFYDRRIPDLARAASVQPVNHVNVELHGGIDTEDVWLPSPWLAERYPGVPIVEVHPPEPPADVEYGPRDRIVHIAGHTAAADRNGTQIVQAAMARLPRALRDRCLVRSQAQLHRRYPGLEIVEGDEPDRWAAYRDAALLIQPRRYGGLSMVLEEALATRTPVVASDRVSERWYQRRGLDVRLAPVELVREIRLAGRRIPCDNVAPHEVGRLIQEAAERLAIA